MTQISQEGKTRRGYRAYLELLDTADWLKGELRGPLASFGVAMGDFRVLTLLYKEGAQARPDIAKKRRIKRQNLNVIERRLMRRGWVGRMVLALPPVEFKRAHLANSRRDEKRQGHRLHVVGLTKEGKQFVGSVLPNHSKFVKALMRALDGREQESLFRICRKLRAGNPVRFSSEIMHEDDD
ncbi:MAG TPA: hypothetical protein VHX36_01775 [Candidatus Acidoferrales bacterium]|jgi:DNA-binding MarR family transcriptional regulator|nr:hypothetical protein [Candidatus Acidoferrales bacterium]